MDNEIMIQKLDYVKGLMDGLDNEIYEKRNVNDKIDVYKASDIISLYAYDMWETLDEVIAALKGE